MKRFFYTLFVIFLQKINLFAQSPYSILERAVSVRFTNTPTKEALVVVSRTGRFEFSYNARILDLDKRITLFTNGLTVRETLFQILGEGYNFQQQGEYLIIKKNNKPQKLLTGYISDAKTGKKVKNATVYDAQTLRSTVTDSNGFYSLKVNPRATVVVAQLAYERKIVQITEGSPRFVKFDLEFKPEANRVEKSNNFAKMPTKLANMFISSLQELNNVNVEDSIHRRFQLSLLPFIGTNHRMSGRVVNDFSINILAGYSRGNRFVELAGIANLTREYANGLQAAGVFNIVKGNVKGVQLGGVFNHVGDTLRGIQYAGTWNFAHTTRAISQISGFANLAWHGTLLTQFAGSVNVADSINGIQAAGTFNQAKNVNGLQASGFVNNAKKVNGVQIASIFNRARSIKGTQIGLINYADSLNGFQLGLINIARVGGFNALELSTNELNTYNIAYKSGSRKFYTTLVVGMTPQSDGNIWTHGLGIGTMLKLNKWSDVNIEAQHRHVNVGSYNDYLQEWFQLGLYWNIHLSNRFELNLGPTFNGLVTDKFESPAIGNRDKIFPSSVKRNVYVGTNEVWDTWTGGNLGLRVRLFK